MNAPELTHFPPARTFCCRIVATLFALTFVLALAAAPAKAQVIALVNGAPVTELDVTQRIKIVQVTTHKTVSRQEALKSLIDDHIKISVLRRYGAEPSSQDVDNVFASMAQRSHMTSQQMEQSMTKQGLSVSALKLKIKADVGWSNLVRGKFSSTLQISDADIRLAMGQSADADKKDDASGNIYTLYPITFVAPGNAADGARLHEAENLRGRFTSCEEGLKLARILRGVVVREPVKRNSADLAPQLREILDKMDVGRLTAPEVTPQGIQMFALCERKETDSESAARRAIREKIYSERFEAESKKYLEEVRRQSMIEYR